MRARAPGRAHAGACQAPRRNAAGRDEGGEPCGECPGLGARPRGRTRASTMWSSTASGWAWTRGAWRPCACVANPARPQHQGLSSGCTGWRCNKWLCSLACSRCLAPRPATEGGGAAERPPGARREHAQPGRRQARTRFWRRRRPLACSGRQPARAGCRARLARTERAARAQRRRQHLLLTWLSTPAWHPHLVPP
jgi:hypothetical protein